MREVTKNSIWGFLISFFVVTVITACVGITKDATRITVADDDWGAAVQTYPHTTTLSKVYLEGPVGYSLGELGLVILTERDGTQTIVLPDGWEASIGTTTDARQYLLVENLRPGGVP